LVVSSVVTEGLQVQQTTASVNLHQVSTAEHSTLTTR